MASVGLLQKLEEADTGYTGVSQSESAVFDSILLNLRVILNSREGCCEIRPDFGLRDFNSTSDYRSLFRTIALDVERQIRLFEPRLRNVSVSPVEDKTKPLELVFQISADLAYDDKLVRVAFSSILGSDGRIRCNG